MKRNAARILALLLCMALFLSLLAGCGGQSAEPLNTAEPAPEATPAAPPEETPPEEEPYVPEPGVVVYDEEASFTFEYEGEVPQKYDEETFYGFEYEGDPVQTVPADASPELTERLEGGLPEAPEVFEPIAEEAPETGTPAQTAGQADGAQSALQDGSLLDRPLAVQTGDGPASSELETEVYTAGKSTKSTAPKQLTIEDIQAMNPDSVVIDIYTNNGYLSTLVGKYYDKKVRNMEDGVLSVQGMASLLGLGKGCEFFAVYSETNNQGYTFYTYQQRYGDFTLRYCTLRIVVDPNGYTAGLSCSFIPNIGTASQEPLITAGQAEEIVRKRFADQDLIFYPEHTVQLAVPLAFAVYNCFVVYTNNPNASAAGTELAFDMPYLEHFVSTDGSYLTHIPANNFATASADVIDNSSYFEGLQVKTLAKTVKLADGTKRDVAVPVSYNSRDGKYYLMDPSRKIAVAQYYDLNYRNTVNLVSSSTLDGWSDNNLMAYANYIILYDFYADHGIRSVDGFGVPILITVGWCEADGTPVDNACFYGINQGWACFGVSDINHSSDCVDVVGHEYTHGVTNLSMQGSVYQNETGAINEAYSDIMGNLAEMSMGYTSDKNWLIAERSGRISRNMSDPNQYRQPAFVGDVYYWASVLNPDFDVNDYGGVHVNNSLLGHIAYRMGQSGMSYEQQIGLWLNSIELITPRSNYEDLHGALLFSLKINGLLTKYGPALNRAFADAGLNDDWSKTYLNATRKGYGRVSFDTDETIAAATGRFYLQSDKKVTYSAFPDENGRVSLLVPAGTYIAQFSLFSGDQRYNYNYTGSGWVQGGSYEKLRVKDGDVIELISTSGKKPAQTTGAQDKLKLVNYDGGYFSMLVPEGWRIEVSGEYGSFSVKIFDPDDPSTQMFFYGGLAPYHKSESTRSFWRKYDTVIGNGPVLPVANILGVLATWSYAIQYQAYYDVQLFTDLYDIQVTDGGFFSGPYAGMNAIESGCFAYCGTNWDDDCKLTIACSLVDNDPNGIAFGGNMFYACYSLCGVLAPEDRYDAVFEDLLGCLESLTFTNAYIRASQSSSVPMVEQRVITGNLKLYCNILRELYETFGA